MNKSEIIDIFQGTIEKPLNDYLDKRLSDGGKCIGYYCSSVPVELFTAAGMVPYRIRGAGSTNTSLAEVYVGTRWCSFVKHSLNLALQGEFDFLSGIVSMNSCESVRKAYEIIERKTSIPFKSLISVPRSRDENLIGWYRRELARVIRELEEQFSISITSESLSEAIKTHNAVRRNLIRLSELRKSPCPAITGEEALTVSIAASVMPVEDFNPLIESLLQEAKARQEPQRHRVRLIVSGGELDEPDLVRIIEEEGGLVVYDDVCFGARSYEELVPEEGDPLTEIARRYLLRVPCGRVMDGSLPRYENLQRAREEYRADGAIFQRMTFCSPNSGLAFDLRCHNKTSDARIPILYLDREYLSGGTGQIRTRVQAFIESIEQSRS